MEIKENTTNEAPKAGFALSKQSIYFFAAGIIMIILGFILMSGGGSDNPEVFNPDIFNTQRITIAPILVVGGFVVNIIGIMINPKK